MKPKTTKRYLSRSIILKASLSTSLDGVRTRLEKYPDIKFLESRREIRFIATDANEICYEFQLSKQYLMAKVLSTTVPPEHFLHNALLRLLSVSSFLEGCYAYEIESVFPVMIDVLSRQHLSQHAITQSRTAADRSGDLLLARRINSLLKERSELSDRCGSLNRELNRLTVMLITSRYGSSFSIEDLKKDGIFTEDMLKARLNEIEKSGYKIIRLDKQKMALVRS
jgi:hypothetical protein